MIAAPAIGELPVLAAGTAFLSVFAVFVAALVVLAVVTLRWALRRDRTARDEWLRRRQGSGGSLTPPTPPQASGRPPDERSRGRQGRERSR